MAFLKGLWAGCNRTLKFLTFLHPIIPPLGIYSEKVIRDTYKNVHFKDVHHSIIYHREKQEAAQRNVKQ